MQRLPTLASSCARAATAAEARFRISLRREEDPRATRIIALDDGAAASLRRLADRRWTNGHFLIFDRLLTGNGSGGAPTDALLRRVDGSSVTLSEELDGADVAVMLATPAASVAAATVIGDASASRLIMFAALVIAAPEGDDGVVAALRPHAMVLVVLEDEADVPEILTALRV